MPGVIKMLATSANAMRCTGMVAAGMILPTFAFAVRKYHMGRNRLFDVLPADLDLLSSPVVISATGVQVLLFAGFEPSARGWRREGAPPLTLAERLSRITPTWKTADRGGVSYEWDMPHAAAYRSASSSLPLSLFREAALAPHALRTATTVRAMCQALERIGLHADDFDGPARRALATMLRWVVDSAAAPLISKSTSPGARVAPMSSTLGLLPSSRVHLLVLSFDATAACRTLSDCPTPGPTNELLAATAIEFVKRRRREYGQPVGVVAQWEVAAAMSARGSAAHPVGTPGVFENTAQIFDKMFDLIETECGQPTVGRQPAQKQVAPCPADGEGGCVRTEGGDAVQLVLLAHPDHLPRAMAIGQTLIATRTAAAAERGSCIPPLLPAMRPYRLDWPSRPTAEGGLYANVSTIVHTAGVVQKASWYDERNGFFPDGEPQRWAHRREIWILYDQWARAKGVATDIMAASTRD